MGKQADERDIQNVDACHATSSPAASSAWVRGISPETVETLLFAIDALDQVTAKPHAHPMLVLTNPDKRGTTFLAVHGHSLGWGSAGRCPVYCLCDLGIDEGPSPQTNIHPGWPAATRDRWLSPLTGFSSHPPCPPGVDTSGSGPGQNLVGGSLDDGWGPPNNSHSGGGMRSSIRTSHSTIHDMASQRFWITL